MITLFLSTSCTSCRRARAWLDEHRLEYKERDMIKQPPEMEELMEILALTENGTSDIISVRSKAFKALDLNLEEIHLQKLYEIIHSHPDILKKPIMFDDRRIQIGYHEDEIRKFIPRICRQRQLVEAQIQIEEMPEEELQ